MIDCQFRKKSVNDTSIFMFGHTQFVLILFNHFPNLATVSFSWNRTWSQYSVNFGKKLNLGHNGRRKIFVKILFVKQSNEELGRLSVVNHGSSLYTKTYGKCWSCFIAAHKQVCRRCTNSRHLCVKKHCKCVLLRN